tara:strand:+ start:160 stop:324 length:165 start_codon:yes stop_codon:yes gene_type:complete
MSHNLEVEEEEDEKAAEAAVQRRALPELLEAVPENKTQSSGDERDPILSIKRVG